MRPAHFFQFILLTSFLFSGCATYKPKFDENADYLKRVESQDNGPVRVSVVGLSAQESKKTFGTDLTGKFILPIWIKIENNDPDHAYFFVERSIDPDYYTAGEAAFMYQLHIGYRVSGKIFPPFLVGIARILLLPLDSLFSHAANAKARASQMESAGKISSAEKAKIYTKANKVLGKGKKKVVGIQINEPQVISNKLVISKLDFEL